MSRFRQEIAEQPAVAERVLGSAAEPVRTAAAAIAAAEPAGLVIAARGSSDHAAVYAKYLFETRNGLPVALAAPSTFTLYRRPPRLQRFAVLAISQAGASPDVVEVLSEARRQGSVTVALTNHPDSALARAAEHVVQLGAGEELSVPATKTYTATLLVLAMLSDALSPEPAFTAALGRIPRALRSVLDAETALSGLAGELVAATRLAVLGRGYNLATALEVGLKLMEAAYVVAEARSVADFRHGPIAIVEPGFPALLLQAAGPAAADLDELGADLDRRGARVLSIGEGAGQPPGRLSVRLDTGLPEALTPLTLAAAGQLVTAGLARARGLHPDRPRGLRKVTSTR
ncbi:MAG TPA: SIS domain-containing protein [Candidatus Dormibacteraeota bacterium]|nr:SIS domain-containing protein [Candidatus Dormibacteraeota bacterium]